MPLTQHKFLNGAYFFSGYQTIKPSQSTTIPSESEQSERTIKYPSKIYTSEVNNPFVFPVTNINTVGTGDIIAVSSAVKALSEGQFGQFPLYVFSTDGIWAMDVSSSGTYSVKQPITRDVCTSKESIAQVDGAVLSLHG